LGKSRRVASVVPEDSEDRVTNTQLVTTNGPAYAKATARQAVMWQVERDSQVRLDEFWTRVDVNLAQERITGVNEPMRCVRRNDDDAARFYLALLISDRDGGAAFDGECDLDVRMLM
jgi:hypothetical protein